METELEIGINDVTLNENISPNFDDIEVVAEVSTQIPQTPIGAISASTQSKKRKRANQGSLLDQGSLLELFDTLNDIIIEMKTSYAQQTEAVTKQTESFNEMVSCFKHEKDVADQRKLLFGLLNDIVGLTKDEKNKALLIIGTDPMLCDIVFSLPSESLLSFVKTILTSKSTFRRGSRYLKVY